MCEEKRRRERERWENEVEGIRTEEQVWKVVNRERRRRRRVEEGIRMERWERVFQGVVRRGRVECEERG